MILREVSESLPSKDTLIGQCIKWEESQLQHTPEEIWGSVFPEKVRRILLLVKYGLGTNPHIFVPGSAIRDGGLMEIVPYLRDLGWGNIQASTSTQLDKKIQESPVLQVSSHDTVSDYYSARDTCGADFCQTVKNESKFISEQVFKDDEEALDWFWNSSIFIFYPNRWDSKTVGWIGGNFSIESRIQTPKRNRYETMKLEAAPDFMSADVANRGVGLPGYRYYGVGETEYYPEFGLITTNDNVYSVEGIALDDPDKLRTRDMVMRSLWRDLTRDPNFRSSLLGLQNVTGTDELFINWYYHEDRHWPDSHRVICFDFDRAIR